MHACMTRHEHPHARVSTMPGPKCFHAPERHDASWGWSLCRGACIPQNTAYLSQALHLHMPWYICRMQQGISAPLHATSYTLQRMAPYASTATQPSLAVLPAHMLQACAHWSPQLPSRLTLTTCIWQSRTSSNAPGPLLTSSVLAHSPAPLPRLQPSTSAGICCAEEEVAALEHRLGTAHPRVGKAWLQLSRAYQAAGGPAYAAKAEQALLRCAWRGLACGRGVRGGVGVSGGICVSLCFHGQLLLSLAET